MYRTHSCGELTEKDIDKETTLSGWVRLTRDHGSIKFIDLADRYGYTQIVFDPKTFSDMKSVNELGREYVIKVSGTVRKRDEDTFDERSQTGKIEVLVKEMQILNKSIVPPFEITEQKKGFLPSEEMRLKYRYLDIRRKEMINVIEMRDKLTKLIREFFWNNNFLELETPSLVRSTPEGARDFLVPSRLHPGHFYALPQSPQLYKQLLMVSGLDKYFQIAKCYRDEDIRDDRQPEFTQVDVEMSFVDEENIFKLIESLFSLIWKEIKCKEKISFKNLSFDEAMTKYGTDAPDLRYDLEMKDVTDLVSTSSYKIFLTIAKKGGKVRCMKAENCKDKISKKSANKLIADVIKNAGAKGLTWIYVEDNKLKSIPEPIAESFSSDLQSELIIRMNAKNGDVLFFIADEPKKSMYIGGRARIQIAEMLNLINKSEDSFVWIDDFPLFEDSEGGRPTSKHHPFTAPDDSSIKYLEEDISKVNSKAYDVVINGVEIGGGSIRIHDANLQEKVLKILGISDKEIKKEFGFLIDALKYGAPPHGGFALGLDRLVAVLADIDNLRDVILFPKTKKFYSPVDDAPTTVKEDQLKELHIIAFGDEE